MLLSFQGNGCFRWTPENVRVSESQKRTAYRYFPKYYQHSTYLFLRGIRVKQCFELLIHTITRLDAQKMLSERSQTQQNTYSIYMEFRTGRPVHGDRNQNVFPGGRGRNWQERSIKEFSGMNETFCILFWMVVIQMCAIVKIHQLQHPRSVHFHCMFKNVWNKQEKKKKNSRAPYIKWLLNVFG